MKKILTTPISYEQIKDLRIGDTVYLTGYLSTCRDSGHKRVVKEGILPTKISLKEGAIFHAGPIVGKDENGENFSKDESLTSGYCSRYSLKPIP